MLAAGLGVGAMKTAPELARNPPTLLPETFHAGAYVEAWNFMDLARYFTNTVIIAAGAWLIFQRHILAGLTAGGLKG